jgi:hypothetical protein
MQIILSFATIFISFQNVHTQFSILIHLLSCVESFLNGKVTPANYKSYTIRPSYGHMLHLIFFVLLPSFRLKFFLFFLSMCVKALKIYE